MLIEKGTLWKRVIATTRHALAAGALIPVPTSHTFIEEAGVRFFVRIMESLKRKDEARRKQDSASKEGKSVNPFLSPEPDLTVGDVTPDHIAILNKFNVVEHHVLIITRHFEDQNMLLTPQDFEALWFCMAEYDSLGFYNGGREAGASQQHKHLQVVPLPLAPEGPEVPVEPLLHTASAGGLAVVPAFPFLHSYVRLSSRPADSPADAARETYALYCSMLKHVGMQPPRPSGLTSQSMPYCLLMTRGWMLLIPRSREHLDSVSLNSLAFAGSFFVRNEEELERLKTYGLMNALKAVALER